MRTVTIFLAGSALALSGCASTSFAPPEVSLSRQMGEQSAAENCLAPAGGGAIAHDVPGALLLIDNFLGAYRCTLRVAADGRRGFQIPSFLALVGSTTAVALGGGADWAIAGGAANSVFTAGNDYFDPVEQTEILDDAIEALDCVQMEAVGVQAFVTAPEAADAAADARRDAAREMVEAAEMRAQTAERVFAVADAEATRAANAAAQADSLMNVTIAQVADPDARAAQLARIGELSDRSRAAAVEARGELSRAQQELSSAYAAIAPARAALAQAEADDGGLGEIEIAAEEQYFRMISGALVRVEGIAARRLSQRGIFDPAGVAAQIEDLVAKIRERQAEANAGGAGAEAGGEGAQDEDAEGNQLRAMANLFANPVTRNLVTQVRLQLRVLRPKLDRCILLAQA